MEVLAILAIVVAVGVTAAYRRVAAWDRANPPPIDNLDMPAIYQQRNGALYGRPSVAPSAPGTAQAGKEGWGPRG